MTRRGRLYNASGDDRRILNLIKLIDIARRREFCVVEKSARIAKRKLSLRFVRSRAQSNSRELRASGSARARECVRFTRDSVSSNGNGLSVYLRAQEGRPLSPRYARGSHYASRSRRNGRRRRRPLGDERITGWSRSVGGRPARRRDNNVSSVESTIFSRLPSSLFVACRSFFTDRARDRSLMRTDNDVRGGNVDAFPALPPPLPLSV